MAQAPSAASLLPWPDVGSAERPGETVRQVLDYICWISKEMRQVGFHSGPRREEWSRRVHQAYAAMFVPTVHGFGDPYPPDVPPPQNPGIWPDIPAAAIPGMTLRHQLTVIGMLGRQLRSRDWLHARPGETEDWDKRLARVRVALDHGETLPMPAEEGTEPAPEVLEAAAAQRAALEARAKRRALELRRQMARLRRERAAAKKGKGKGPAKKKAAKKKAAKKKAAKKKVAKKATRKKAATKKATAKKKKASKKGARKTAAKKRAAKTASKKTAKKAAKKKKASKKAAKKKKARKTSGRRRS